MTDEKFDPMKELTNLRESVSKVIGQGLNAVNNVNSQLRLDIVEIDDEVIVYTSPLDGLDASTLEVSVENGILTISGETKPEELPANTSFILQERRFEAFSRSVEIPLPLKANQAQAKLTHGKLTVTIPIDRDSYHNIEITPVE